VDQPSRQQATNSAGYDYALLHVYRKGRVGGSAINYDLYIDDKVICRVKNKWYEPIKIDKEGEITLWAKTEAKSELPIMVSFGKEYYIRCGLEFGVVVGRPYLELVDEETGESEIASIQGTASQSNRQQTTNERNKTQTTANPFQGVALGVNALTGYTFKNSYMDVGFGARLSYTFSVPIRLAGEFNILWGIPTNETWFIRTRWMDYGVCLQYLFLPGNKRVAIYPLVGIGGVNEKEKIEIKFPGIEDEEIESSINRFAFTLGYGFEGLSKNGKFCYGFGMRIKIANKAMGNNWGYRIHTVFGIGYKF
jgi:opacity protein-like surface antigen